MEVCNCRVMHMAISANGHVTDVNALTLLPCIRIDAVTSTTKDAVQDHYIGMQPFTLTSFTMGNSLCLLRGGCLAHADKENDRVTIINPITGKWMVLADGLNAPGGLVQAHGKTMQHCFKWMVTININPCLHAPRTHNCRHNFPCPTTKNFVHYLRLNRVKPSVY